MHKALLLCLLAGMGTAGVSRAADATTARAPDIETVTQNWSVIPDSVFPLSLRVVRDTVTRYDGSDVTLKPGTVLTAMSLEGSNLTCAYSSRGYPAFLVLVDHTDFKARVTALYKEWADRLEAVAVYDGSLHSREAETARKSRQMDATTVFDAIRKRLDADRLKKFFEPDGRLKRNPDGSYPLLLESMQTGQVTEITKENIKTWGVARSRVKNGRRYWVVEVEFRNTTVFGSLYSQAEAWIKGSRVDKWLYVGSGEVVP